MIKEEDYLFKVVIVGNQGVGKSSLFVRFCDDQFAQNYLPTIGVDFRFKMLQVDAKYCKMQIWDTAGQERFRTITSAYYRSSQVVLIVFDVTDEASFKEVEEFWIQQAKNNSDSEVIICLVGNKYDRPVQTHTVTQYDVDTLADSIGLRKYRLSAKTGEGVTEMFTELCTELMKTAKIRKRDVVPLDVEGEEGEGKKKKCCKG